MTAKVSVAGGFELSSELAHVEVGELSIERAQVAMAGAGGADIIYSDPPWGAGNLKYWRTHNGELESRPDWAVFMATFCQVVAEHRKPSAPVFIEMGQRWADELARAMDAVGIVEAARWTAFYGSPKRPNVLWFSGPLVPESLILSGGDAMTMSALRSVARPNSVVLDPCCGKGMTARCALKLGMRFRGVELNPKRAAVTRTWCESWAKRRPAT